MLLLVPFSSRALDVEYHRLGLSVGFLRLQQPPHTSEYLRALKVYSAEFDEFHTARDHDEYMGWIDLRDPSLAGPADTMNFMFGAESIKSPPATTIFEDRAENRLFTIWSHDGGERTTHAIVIWHSAGNTLTLEAVLNLALVEFMGGAFICEVHRVDSQRFLIIGRSGGGDEGEGYESVWAALWTKPRDLQMLHSVSTRSDQRSESDLRYSIDPRKLRMTFSELRRTYPDDPSTVEDPRPPTKWAVEKSWSVDLTPLIKGGSSRSKAPSPGTVEK